MGAGKTRFRKERGLGRGLGKTRFRKERGLDFRKEVGKSGYEFISPASVSMKGPGKTRFRKERGLGLRKGAVKDPIPEGTWPLFPDGSREVRV